MNAVQFHVYGDPQPQGSKRHVGNGVMIESAKKLKPWRRDVTEAAEEATAGLFYLDGPLHLSVTFYIRRPKSHYRTGRFAHLLRADAPRHCVKTPDTDKLVRAIGDALTGVVYQDDSQIAHLSARKLYGEKPGAFIRVFELRSLAA